MKKLMLLALLPLAISCNKSNDLKVGTDATLNGSSLKQNGSPITISTTQNFNGFTNSNKDIYTGNFNSSGFLTGTGTTQEIVNVTWPSGGNATAVGNANYTFSSNQTFSFSDNSGTITIQTNGSWWLTSTPGVGAGSGQWKVVSGTGNYTQIKGSGSLEITEILFNETGAYSVSDIYQGNLY